MSVRRILGGTAPCTLHLASYVRTLYAHCASSVAVRAGFMMKESRAFLPGTKLETVLETYYGATSMVANTDMLATAAATLGMLWQPSATILSCGVRYGFINVCRANVNALAPLPHHYHHHF